VRHSQPSLLHPPFRPHSIPWRLAGLDRTVPSPQHSFCLHSLRREP
jgi:hypothetical protein